MSWIRLDNDSTYCLTREIVVSLGLFKVINESLTKLKHTKKEKI